MLSTRGVQRAAEDPRGAPGPRRLRAGHHRPPEGAAHHPEPDPALRVPPARARDASASCSTRCAGTPTSTCPTRPSTWPCAGAGDRPATPSRCSTRWPPRTSVDDDLPELDEVVEALAERDVGRALVAVAHLTSAGFSPQQLAGDLVDYLRQGFLALVAPELVAVSGARAATSLASQADRVGLAALVRAMEVLGRAQVAMRDAPDPRVNLEVALVRLTHPEADDSPAALLARIERLEAGPRRGAGAAARRRRARRRRRPPPAVTARHPATRGRPAPTDPPSRRAPEPARRPTPRPRRPALRPRRRRRRRGAGAVGAVGARPADGRPARRRPAAGSLRPARPPRPAAPAPACRRRPARSRPATSWSRPGATTCIGRLRPKAKALFQAGRFVGVDGRPGRLRAAQRDPPEPLRGGAGRGRGGAVRALRPAGRLSTWWSTPEPSARAGPVRGPTTPASAASAGRSAATAGRRPIPRASRRPRRPPAADAEPPTTDEPTTSSTFDVDEPSSARSPRSTTRPRPGCSQAFPGAEEVG